MEISDFNLLRPDLLNGDESQSFSPIFEASQPLLGGNLQSEQNKIFAFSAPEDSLEFASGNRQANLSFHDTETIDDEGISIPYALPDREISQVGAIASIQDAKFSTPTQDPLTGESLDRSATNGDRSTEQWYLRQRLATDVPSSIAEAREFLGNDSDPLIGNGVTIGIVDDGFDRGHLDLADRFRPEVSYDFTDDDSEPSPTSTRGFSGTPENETLLVRQNREASVVEFGLGTNLTGVVDEGAGGVAIALDIDSELLSEISQQGEVRFSFVPTRGINVPFHWFSAGWSPAWPAWGNVQQIESTPDLTQGLLLDVQGSSYENAFDEFSGNYAGGVWRLRIDVPAGTNLDVVANDLVRSWDLTVRSQNSHGTAVAGIAAANDDGEGIVGVAPGASLAGLRLLGDVDPVRREIDPQGSAIANALFDRSNGVLETGLDRNQEIDIFVNSWGIDALHRPLDAIQALARGATEGRNGKGNIYLFAAGNEGQLGGDVNDNALANSRHSIAVGAIGIAADGSIESAPYSTPGAALFVSALSGHSLSGDANNAILTTQTDGGHQTFSGTSAATPWAAGVVALMLEANPELTARDVQHILADSALPIDLDYQETEYRKPGSEPQAWTTNGAGRAVSYRYGFGAVDPVRAVELAQEWEPVGEEVQLSSAQQFVNAAIQQLPAPEATPQYQEALSNTVASHVTFDGSITIENIEVALSIEHDNWDELTVVLTHDADPADPNNPTTESILALASESPGGIAPDDPAWVFSSTRHWGESSEGLWTLQVFDENDNEVTGTLNSWQLDLFGTAS